MQITVDGNILPTADLKVITAVGVAAPGITSVTIAGTGQVTSALTSAVVATGLPAPQIAYQWQFWDGADWDDISDVDSGYDSIAATYLDADISLFVMADNGVGDVATARSNSITVIRAEPVATNNLGPFDLDVGADLEAIDVAAEFTDPGFPDVSALTFTLAVGPSWLNVDPDTGVPSGTADAAYDGPVVIGGASTGGYAETTFNLTVYDASFAPRIATPPVLGGSTRIGDIATVTAPVWESNPPLVSSGGNWEVDLGSGFEEVDGATDLFVALGESFDEVRLRYRADADNGVHDPVSFWTDPITVTYQAPAPTPGVAVWTVSLSSMPAMLDAKKLFRIPADQDFSAVTSWVISGVPTSAEGPFVGGVMDPNVYVVGGDPLDLTIDGNGVLDLNHGMLLADTPIRIQCTNSGGPGEKEVILRIVAEIEDAPFALPWGFAAEESDTVALPIGYLEET